MICFEGQKIAQSIDYTNERFVLLIHLRQYWLKGEKVSCDDVVHVALLDEASKQ